ncbi:MAG: hypothetical protein C4324_01845 [Blastocatellia bacterium]
MTRRSWTEWSGKPLSETPEPKPKGLLRLSKRQPSCPDKNGQRPLELISQSGAKAALKSKDVRASLPGT